MKRLALTALLVVSLAAALGASAATPGFTPKLLAGTWSGTWMNETFGSTGAAKIVATAPKNTRLNFTVDFGGNVFGCQDPPPSAGGLPKGKGPNTWSAAGFTIKKDSPTFGTTNLTYVHKTKKLTGSGMNPTCSPGLKWALDGAFAGKTFTGTVRITLPDGTPATSKLNLTRA